MTLGDGALMDGRSLWRRLCDYIEWQWSRLLMLPSFCINYLFGRIWNDWFLSIDRRLHFGQQPLKSRVAVYVIFPVDGLSNSHLESMDYLTRKGVSTLVVSNVALSTSDRNRLLPHCWRLLERSNFGYDFGAYRDGVLHLLNGRYEIDLLYLFNDSVWFPVPLDADWIEKADQLNVDFVGAVSNGGFDHLLGRAKFEEHDWFLRFDSPNLHYCSFALCIRSRILRDPDFKSFWRSLRICNDKKMTIARGEIGLSRWIIDNGYSHAATLDLSGFDAVLLGMSADELKEFGSNLIIPENAELRAELSSLLEAPRSSGDCGSLIRFLLRATAETGPAYALAHWAIGKAGHSFLKKSPLWLSSSTAEITVRLAERHASDAVLNEAVRIRMNSGRAAP